MRISQRIWNELIFPNLEVEAVEGEDPIVSCPKFFYMEDEKFNKFLKQKTDDKKEQ